jgi:hypothetical protein
LLQLAPGGVAVATPPGPYLLDEPGVRELGPADVAARPAKFPFPVGERLEYAVRWFGVPAGHVSIEVARYVEFQGRRYAHAVAIARTNEVFSAIYEVNDRSEAWIDLDRFATERTHAVEKHGRKHYDETVRYDRATHLLHARLDKVHKRQRKDVVFDFGPFAYDTSDLVYLLRALPLTPGYAVGVPTYANRKIFEFHIEVDPAKEIESPALGRVAALGVRPSTVLDGKPYAVGDGVVWVAGPARVPVRLDGWIRTAESSFLVQGLRAELTAYVPAAPGWSPPHAPVVQPITTAPTTRDGIPQWDPPAAVANARAAAGQAPRELRSEIPRS